MVIVCSFKIPYRAVSMDHYEPGFKQNEETLLMLVKLLYTHTNTPIVNTLHEIIDVKQCYFQDKMSLGTKIFHTFTFRVVNQHNSQ